jgi:hypothetical protein
MGLPMSRPFCKSIYRKECNVESSKLLFWLCESNVSSSVSYVHSMFGLVQEIVSCFVQSGCVK